MAIRPPTRYYHRTPLTPAPPRGRARVGRRRCPRPWPHGSGVPPGIHGSARNAPVAQGPLPARPVETRLASLTAAFDRVASVPDRVLGGTAAVAVAIPVPPPGGHASSCPPVSMRALRVHAPAPSRPLSELPSLWGGPGGDRPPTPHPAPPAPERKRTVMPGGSAPYPIIRGGPGATGGLSTSAPGGLAPPLFRRTVGNLYRPCSLPQPASLLEPLTTNHSPAQTNPRPSVPVLRPTRPRHPPCPLRTMYR